MTLKKNSLKGILLLIRDVQESVSVSSRVKYRFLSLGLESLSRCFGLGFRDFFTVDKMASEC